MEEMKRALAQLAKEIEELKFAYIEAERRRDHDKMECIIDELDVLEAYYNHQAAILNGDADTVLTRSQEDVFIQRIQNDSFEYSSPSLIQTDGSETFRARWTKLHEALKQQKKEHSSCIGFCYVCLCDVPEDDLIIFSCGHSVCVGECGVRLPSPFCPAPTCNKSIDDVFTKFERNADSKKRKAEETEDALLADRMRELRARGVVACAAPSANDASIDNPPILPVSLSAPDIIVIDDEDDGNNDDEDEVVFIECRKP